MKLNLVIEKQDIEIIKQLNDEYKQNEDVLWRIKSLQNPIEPTREQIWKQMVVCMITSQQRSGRDSLVGKFERLEPFPLRYSKCVNQKNLKNYVSDAISKHGLRFANKISINVTNNLKKLEEDNWCTLSLLLKEILLEPDISRKMKERQVARQISKMFKGFGPKQSRHLLIGLGLARYEIPIDSRILKWINTRLGEKKIPSQGLSDEVFFSFVLDRIQELSKRADLLPAIVDILLFVDADSRKQK